MDNENYQSLNIEDSIYTTQLTKKYLNRKVWQQPNLDEMYSYIPGTVSEVFITLGQEVTEGQNIMVLEAMKMLNQIVAHKSGKITALNVAVGDKIPKGHLMLVISSI